MVQVTLRGDPDDAGKHVDGLKSAVADSGTANPDARVQVAGPGTIDATIDQIVEKDLQKAEMISLPITLVILFIAFGALVAASVPLLLGITSVAGAIGGMGLISQVAPMGDAAGSLVVLIGLAVGVDYSLFYVRREREERRNGREADAALRATSATVGRAVVVSGLTVIVALAGMLVTGLAVFASMALATMLVVAIAVVGSVTVLPAVLAKLGDGIDRGRLPGARRRARRRAARPPRVGVVGAHRPRRHRPAGRRARGDGLHPRRHRGAGDRHAAVRERQQPPRPRAGRAGAARDRGRVPRRAGQRRARRPRGRPARPRPRSSVSRRWASGRARSPTAVATSPCGSPRTGAPRS